MSANIEGKQMTEIQEQNLTVYQDRMIKMLEEYLELARDGKIRSINISAIDNDRNGLCQFVSDPEKGFGLSMVGALDVSKATLLSYLLQEETRIIEEGESK